MTTTTATVPLAGRAARLPYVLLAWALGYGALRAFWALGNQPDFPPVGYDLLGVPGWGAAALSFAAGALGLATLRRPASRFNGWAVVVASWAVVGALVAAAGLILLDIVGGLFAGLGIYHSLGGFLSRAGCLAGGLLLGRVALTYQRTVRDACIRCGRLTAEPTQARTPTWAYAAAYVAVGSYLLRLVAQYAVGFGDGANPLHGKGVTATISEWGFLIGTALAGVLLPLALVHRFGRIWPRWTLFLAGRRVPRWLVLGPAFALSAGLVAYFGTGMIQMITDPFESTGALPGWFFWVAVPAYVVWGLGLGVAAFAYRAMTRPSCGSCGAPATQR